jgi:ABC-type nitrate/sulfonate/bicarbonate transport system substrate-binding protein
MTTAHSVVNVSPNNPVFDLPIYVARDEGLFERAGIEVRFRRSTRSATLPTRRRSRA